MAPQLREHSRRESLRAIRPSAHQVLAAAHERDRNGAVGWQRLSECAHEAEELPRLSVRHRVRLVVEIDTREPVVAHNGGGGEHKVGGPGLVWERVLEPRVCARAADAYHAAERPEWVVSIRVL